MSELKATSSGEIRTRDDQLGYWWYEKSEADKVIALLKDKANYNEYAKKHKSEELADTCRFYDDELRHNKYKRCFAMAMWCRLNRLDAADYRIPRKKWEFYDKWYKRWLKIAEKFKEKK